MLSDLRTELSSHDFFWCWVVGAFFVPLFLKVLSYDDPSQRFEEI